MATPQYKKSKYLSPEQFEEITQLSEEELVAKIKEQDEFLSEKEDERKGSELLKEMRAEIKEYRDKCDTNNPEDVAELERLKDAMKAIKTARDAAIESDLEEKKETEAIHRDNINGAKAHIRAMCYCLRFFQ